MDPEHGTNELLEVAYRFGRAVTALATGADPLRARLVEAGRALAPVDGALSGLWPEPHVPADLADQVRGLLVELHGGSEEAVAALDDDAVARTCQHVTALAFALHQEVGAASA